MRMNETQQQTNLVRAAAADPFASTLGRETLVKADCLALKLLWAGPCRSFDVSGCGMREAECMWAHGVAVSHPLCMRKALGSIPSVSNVVVSARGTLFRTRSEKREKQRVLCGRIEK